MNRLILIGNGFDIAHGLPTRYSSFIIHYLKKAIMNALDSGKGRSTDGHLIVEIVDRKDNSYFINSLNSISTVKELNEHPNFSIKGLKKQRLTNKICINLTAESKFLERLLLKFHSTDPNWVDIETEYFLFVKETLEGKFTDKSQKESIIYAVHATLEFLSKELRGYLILKSEVQIKNAEFLEKMKRLVFPVKYYNDNEVSQSFGATLILNFNYTRTIEQHVTDDFCLRHNISIQNIHGSIYNESHMIFGYGPINSEEKLIHNADILDLSKRLKGRQYNRYYGHMYQDFIAFTRQSYEVVVLGHSLGSSDGTMLESIFNSKTFMRVHVLHYNEDEYDIKQDRLRKITGSDAILKGKLLPLVSGNEIPQLV